MQKEFSRRHFVQMGGALALTALSPFAPSFAKSLAEQSKPTKTAPFQTLNIGYRNIDVNGKAAKVYGLTNHLGKQGLTFYKGEQFRVNLQNSTKEPTLVHWHGLTPPWKYDGVPDVTQPMLQPAKSYDYDFTLNKSGTNWMHAHTLQEQSLLAAPLIIRETNNDDTQEVVLMLHDFSFQSPEQLLDDLKTMKHMHHNADGTMDMDLNDIEYDAYLANDRTLNDPEIILFEQGALVRLRIINGAASTGFFIDTGELEAHLIAVDGNDIIPFKGKLFPMTMAQRMDILLQIPKGEKSYPIIAMREGATERAGIILAAKNAQIKKLSVNSDKKADALNIAFENNLRAKTPLKEKAIDLTAAYDLEGSMMPYAWNLKRTDLPEDKNKNSMQAAELNVKHGQRVKVSFTNKSEMAHPIHMHGQHFQVVAVNGKKINGAVRDTLLIKPNCSADVIFDADNKGVWPLHCHHLYHMVTGMMTYIRYDGFDVAKESMYQCQM